MYVCTGVWDACMSGISLQGLSLKPEFTHMASLVCKLTLGRLSNLPSTGTTTQLLCLVGIYVHSGDRQLGLHVASTLTPLSRTGSEIFVFLLLFVQGWGLIFGFCHHCQVLAQKFWCHEICHSQKATKMTSEGPPPPGSLSTTGGATHQACVWYLLWTHTWRRPWRCPLSCFESEPKQKNRKQISSERRHRSGCIQPIFMNFLGYLHLKSAQGQGHLLKSTVPCS